MGRTDLYLVVAYDVVANGRREKLRKQLRRHLTPVQKSVFEGPIHPRKLDTIVRIARQTVDLDEDTVRIYVLCGGCAGSTVLVGTSRPVARVPDPILV